MSHMFQDSQGKNDSTEYYRGTSVARPSLAAPVAIGEIRVATEILTEHGKVLTDKLAELESRLVAVLAPVQVGVGETAKFSSGFASPHAIELDALGVTYRHAFEKVQGILDRLSV